MPKMRRSSADSSSMYARPTPTWCAYTVLIGLCVASIIAVAVVFYGALRLYQLTTQEATSCSAIVTFTRQQMCMLMTAQLITAAVSMLALTAVLWRMRSSPSTQCLALGVGIGNAFYLYTALQPYWPVVIGSSATEVVSQCRTKCNRDRTAAPIAKSSARRYSRCTSVR